MGSFTMRIQRRRVGGHRLFRKYENLRRRLRAMLADGSFRALEGCRRLEAVRKLARLHRSLQRLCLRAGVATAALAGGFVLLAQAAQAAPGFVPDPACRFPFHTDDPLRQINHAANLIRPVIADLDADGSLDVLVGKYDGTVRWYRNNGTPRHALFSIMGDLAGVNAGADAMPAVGDLDGDGDLDMVAGNMAGELRYFENVGDAENPSYTERVDAENPFDAIAVGAGSCPFLADFDGDGDLDLVLGQYGAYAPLYFENTGAADAPQFTELAGDASPFLAADTVDFPAPYAVDVDRDGDLDVVAGANNGTVHFYENVAGQKKRPRFILRGGADNPFDNVEVPPAPAVGYCRPALADLDADGDLDILAGNGAGIVAFFENIGTPARTDFVERVTTDFCAQPAFVDLDGDGDLDLVVGIKYGAFAYYENTGDATDDPVFVLRTGLDDPFDGLAAGVYTVAPAFADLDGDGDLDMVVGDLLSFGLRFFENTGDANNPAFVEQVGAGNPFDGLALGDYRGKPALVDLDNDGDFDCLVGTKYGSLLYFRNTGDAANPNFVAEDLPPMDDLPEDYNFCPQVADLDEDGDWDLILGAGYYSSAIYYYENTGDAADPVFTRIADGSNPFAGNPSTIFGGAPVVVDLDDDGELEAFVGDKYGAVRRYVLSERVTTGSSFRIRAVEVTAPGGRLAEFLAKPGVGATYFDPVKDLDQLKAKAAKATVLTKVPDAAGPVESVLCEWKAAPKLIDAKGLQVAYKQGRTARWYLERTPQRPLTMDLAVGTVDADRVKFTDPNVKRLTVMPPTIVEVVSMTTFTATDVVQAGEIIAIRAMNLGKGAKAWLEYVDAKGVTKKLGLKTIGTKGFANAKGEPGKAIMDAANGDSLLVVQVPAKLPKGWDHGEPHDLVLDNGIGLVSVAFGTNP